ncbi:hypothetical protein HYW54_02690 [Candidatus Gottesmanbacteria bacterium]|nr:hypothetical protein [Candidatus Gottesmanbacteria bacterium]
MKLQTARVVASGDDNAFGHTVIVNNTFVLFEIKGKPEHPAPKLGETLIHSLSQRLTTHPIDSLESQKSLLHLVKEKNLPAGRHGELATIIIATFLENILYLSLYGDGIVWIKRHGKVVPLLNKEGSMSGEVFANDLLVLENGSAVKTISPETVKKIVSEHDIETIEEKLTSYTLGENTIPGVALIILKVTSSAQTLPPQPPISKGLSLPKPDISGIKDGVLSFIKDKVLQEEDPMMVVVPQKRKTKMILITIALILLILFAVSLSFGISNQFGKVKKEDVEKTVELISHKYDEAVSLIDLNPERSTGLLKEAKKEVNSLLKSLPQDSLEYKKTISWLQKIEEQEIIAGRIYQLPEVPLLFDLEIIRDNTQGSKMAIYDKTIVVLDEQGKRLYALTSAGKQGRIIAGPDVIKTAKSPSIHGINSYIVNSDGIIRIDTRNNTSGKVIDKDSEWGSIGSVVAYAANIYLLDKTKNQIWKYVVTEDGFTDKIAYLAEDVKPNFSDTKSMSIDGSIWVLAGDDILKFTQGRLDVFNLHGAEDMELNPDAIYTNEELDDIYVLEGIKGQIVVYTKDGAYKSTYESQSLKNASDLVVDVESKKIIVLNASKIFVIDIK